MTRFLFKMFNCLFFVVVVVIPLRTYIQELQQLLDEANQSLEESGTPSHEIVVVVLHRGDVASTLSPGLGITLAGGADYETKEITVRWLTSFLLVV